MRMDHRITSAKFAMGSAQAEDVTVISAPTKELPLMIAGATTERAGTLPVRQDPVDKKEDGNAGRDGRRASSQRIPHTNDTEPCRTAEKNHERHITRGHSDGEKGQHAERKPSPDALN